MCRFPVLGKCDAFRDQAIDGIRLVQRRHHQRVEGQFHARRRIALEGERVEGKRVLIPYPSQRGQRETAALWGIWIGIVEMGEIGAVFHVAESRQAVQRLARRLIGKGLPRKTGHKGSTAGKSHKMAAVHAKECHSRSGLMHRRS
ncbi:hypothetical protein M798_07925 [Brucella melitensis ADMAS-G1]|nr:hypothetical protein M798_07925 [Brucella melitensis ADMAS-G1]